MQKYVKFDHDDPNDTIFIYMHTVHGMKYYSYCTVFNNLSYLVYTVWPFPRVCDLRGFTVFYKGLIYSYSNTVD